MFFFFNDTATTEIYTLSLHDALPIWRCADRPGHGPARAPGLREKRGLRQSCAASCPPSVISRQAKRLHPACAFSGRYTALFTNGIARRSEEHTSELQSQSNLVCRLL